jgi:DNA-binding Xre family transcriptional regulator
MKITLRYLPSSLTKKDRILQANELKKSRKMYKKGSYYTRRKVSSYPVKKSHHIINAEKLYHVKKIGATKELSLKTGCSRNALAKIINKGEGAYFSSGSRPNQTAQSWGNARLASAITSGKAASVDYSILEKGCKKGSKALRLAKKSRRKHGHGTRRVPKVNL